MNMLYKIIYFLFIIAISFGGNYHIGAFTIRHFFTVIMAGICLGNIKYIKKYNSFFIVLYFLYLFFVGLSSYFDDSVSDFIRLFFSQHIVALICYFSIAIYYERVKNFNVIIYSFVICGVLNMIVCFMQQLGMPLGFDLGYLFITEADERAITHMTHIENGDYEGFHYLIGMRANVVHNGYFQMIMPFLLSFIYFKSNNKNKMVKLFYGLTFILFEVCIFLIQERSCILFSILVLLFAFYHVFKSSSNSQKIKYIFLTIFLCIISLYTVVSYSILSQSRIFEADSGIHSYLLSSSLSFIYNNWEFGGMNSFLNLYGGYPHNILLNAFIYAGIFGFIICCILYFKQLIVAWKLLSYLNVNSCIIYAFLAYTLNSFLHNDSIISGDAIVWILWSMVYVIFKGYSTINRQPLLRNY